MPLRRSLLALCLASCLAPLSAQAQTFPSRTVRLVLPQPAGTGPDALTRALAEELSKDLGQPFVVENRPGANGALAAAYVISQPADAHTVFVAGVSNLAWNPSLYKTLSYSPARDFVGVAMLAESPFITVVSPQLGVRTLAELLARAKAQPGRLDFASAGIGNSTHLATELLMLRTGIALQHVPFGGAAGSSFYISLMQGETPVMTSVASDIVPLSREGRVVPLAVTGDKRLAPLPHVPTFKELGIDMNVPGWYAMVARTGTAPAAIERLNTAVNKALATSRVRDMLAAQFLEPRAGAASEVERLTERDAKTWGPIIDRLEIAK